jgi:hypothetical protein
MSAYELILTIEPTTFEKMLSLGILRNSVMNDVRVYEFYLNEKKTVSCMQARTNTADKFCTSEETISRIIKRMK